jgi:hypothetical protein
MEIRIRLRWEIDVGNSRKCYCEPVFCDGPRVSSTLASRSEGADLRWWRSEKRLTRVRQRLARACRARLSGRHCQGRDLGGTRSTDFCGRMTRVWDSAIIARAGDKKEPRLAELSQLDTDRRRGKSCRSRHRREDKCRLKNGKPRPRLIRPRSFLPGSCGRLIAPQLD